MKKLIFILAGFTVFILLASFEFSFSRISGHSMEPNYHNGSTLFFHKYLFSSPNPFRGQIVLYRRANSQINYIGRVVVLPGESFMIENGNFYIDNGKQYHLVEEYLPPGTKTTATQEGTWIKLESPNQYLILPDNRNNPIDFQQCLINRYSIDEILL